MNFYTLGEQVNLKSFLYFLKYKELSPEHADEIIRVNLYNDDAQISIDRVKKHFCELQASFYKYFLLKGKYHSDIYDIFYEIK